MNFITDERLKVAYVLSDEIVENVPYSPSRMIDTQMVVAYVQDHYCPKIDLFSKSFTDIPSSHASVCNCGAMMRVDFQDGARRSAVIILNSDMPAKFQRFSLMQQIGHLVTLPQDAQLNPDNYHVSAHIHYNLEMITPEDLENNYYLLREQVANIFALRVLMPSKQFYQKMRELNSVSAAATFFGLAEDAVISRMMIGG